MRAAALLAQEGAQVPVLLWAVASERHAELLAAGGPLVSVPVGPVVERVAAALRAHATQVQAIAVGAETIGFALSNDVPLQIGPSELFEPAPQATRPFAWPDGVQAHGWPVP